MKADTPIRELKGIGEKTESLFHMLGIYTVQDLLLYYPRSYEQFPIPTGPEDLVIDRKNAILVQVTKAPAMNTASRMKTAVMNLPAGDRPLRLIWFHMPYIRSMVKKGGTYIFYGTVTEKKDCYYMDQPQIFAPDKYNAIQGSLQPVYGLTKGISNNQIQKTMKIALSDLPLEMEYMPEDIRIRNHLSEYNYALTNIHFPEDEESCILARRRFVFDEFLFFVLMMRLSRQEAEREGNPFDFGDTSFTDDLKNTLPYALTDAQSRSLDEIRQDMRSSHMMQRLLQGDVGSGKTVVAFLAMLDAAHAGYQAAIMAPTDVLARQHYNKLVDFCQKSGCHYPVVLLTGSLKAKERRQALETIAECPNALIIGTHALIQEKVEFNNLALVITDEQHRFGVHQRETFAGKGCRPHILVMSATPIPRTLAIIIYGDLDISVIDQVPSRRLQNKNCVVSTSWRPKAYQFIEREVAAGHQAYVVCPLVEESEGLEAENVTDYSAKLRENLPSGIRVEMLHGRMKPEQKNQIMEAFLRNEIQVLVSTTVIEVGVDVPNATVMMIENAERFGLAQLHQLRGRVGRGDSQGYCIFVHSGSDKTKNPRLEILNKSNDGFYIAGEDLKLRGPGDFFGIRQSGDFSFRIGDVYQDMQVLKDAAYEATLLLQEDPDLSAPEHERLKQRLAMLQTYNYNDMNL